MPLNKPLSDKIYTDLIFAEANIRPFGPFMPAAGLSYWGLRPSNTCIYRKFPLSGGNSQQCCVDSPKI